MKKLVRIMSSLKPFDLARPTMRDRPAATCERLKPRGSASTSVSAERISATRTHMENMLSIVRLNLAREFANYEAQEGSCDLRLVTVCDNL